MKKSSTHFLRAAVIFMVLAALAFGIFALPGAWNTSPAEPTVVGNSMILIAIGLYLTMIPFFVALWETFKLLRYIDANTAFSELSVKALRNIKRCFVVISALYVAGVPLLYPFAEYDDAPGLLLFGAIVACAPIVVAVFAAVLQKLLQSAIDIKSENDLTV